MFFVCFVWLFFILFKMWCKIEPYQHDEHILCLDQEDEYQEDEYFEEEIDEENDTEDLKEDQDEKDNQEDETYDDYYVLNKLKED
jgi:hypothetical protein